MNACEADEGGAGRSEKKNNFKGLLKVNEDLKSGAGRLTEQLFHWTGVRSKSCTGSVGMCGE